MGIEFALTHGFQLPNTPYFDGLDYNGTLQLGGDAESPQYRTKRYGYVPAIIASNIYRACNRTANSPRISSASTSFLDRDCAGAISLAEKLRKNFPLTLWNDSDYGRVADWPRLPYSSVPPT